MTTSPQKRVFKSLAELLGDGLFVDGDWVESKDQDPNGDVRLIQLADIGDGFFRNRSARFLASQKASELGCTFLKPGDVLVARMPEPLGRACIFPGVGQPAVTAVDVCIMRPSSERIRAEWLVKAINSPSFRSSMQQFVRGTTRQRISRKNLGTLRLHVPSVPEQLATADAIDRQESKRSSASEHLTVARTAIERFRRAVIMAACSGRLTEGWREGRGHKSDGAETPPNGWEQVRVSDVVESIRGGSMEAPSIEHSDYPILRSSSVRQFRIDYSDVRYLQASQSARADNYLMGGDLLITRLSGSIDYVGNAAVVRGLGDNRIQYPDRLFRCRLKDPNEADFLELAFAGPQIRMQIEEASRSAAGHQRISIRDIKAFTYLRPPIDEQRQIVLRVRRLLKANEDILAKVDDASSLLQRTSQATLAKAFPGQPVEAVK